MIMNCIASCLHAMVRRVRKSQLSLLVKVPGTTCKLEYLPMRAQYPLLYKLHLLFVETDACMALFITCFFWGLVWPGPSPRLSCPLRFCCTSRTCCLRRTTHAWGCFHLLACGGWYAFYLWLVLAAAKTINKNDICLQNSN